MKRKLTVDPAKLQKWNALLSGEQTTDETDEIDRLSAEFDEDYAVDLILFQTAEEGVYMDAFATQDGIVEETQHARSKRLDGTYRFDLDDVLLILIVAVE